MQYSQCLHLTHDSTIVHTDSSMENIRPPLWLTRTLITTIWCEEVFEYEHAGWSHKASGYHARHTLRYSQVLQEAPTQVLGRATFPCQQGCTARKDILMIMLELLWCCSDLLWWAMFIETWNGVAVVPSGYRVPSQPVWIITVGNQHFTGQERLITATRGHCDRSI